MKVPGYQVALQAKQIHEADPAAPFIWLRLVSAAFDGTTVEVNNTVWPVIGCASPLAVRDAMRRHTASTTPVVILFDGAEAALGRDVLARCAKRKGFAPDVWQLVLALFRAPHLDPRLARQRWLAELLLRFLPVDGYLPVRSLALDQERAWRELFRVVLAFDAYPPSALALLQWAADARRREHFQRLDSEARQGIGGHWRTLLGEVADLVLAAIETHQADSLLSVGLLCPCLANPEPEAIALAAKVTARLEVFLGGVVLSPALLTVWAEAARAAFAQGAPTEKQQHLARFTEWVGRLKAEPLALRADYGAARFQEKIRAFATALHDLDLAAGEAGLRALMAHQGPMLEERSRQRCHMALRLAGWLSQAALPLPPSLNALAVHYRQQLAWVDWARAVLLEGDEAVELGNAFAQLRAKAGQRRAVFDQQFAEALATEQPDGSHLLPIEDALTSYVAPAAKANRLLLIVMDGMNFAVFLELHHSLQQRGWIECEPVSIQTPTLLAMLPSTTEASRTSLFSGLACRGYAATERTAFKAFAPLVTRSVAGKPPLLFHKKELLDRSGVMLTDDLRLALSDTRQRVVAVVMNAVDDHLSKSDQLRCRWDLAQFKGLDALLAEARSSERVVILTSDHGHILDQETELCASSPHPRWREPDLTAHPGEIRLDGPRVNAASGCDRVMLAWSERIRYAAKRNGYHGGCSPQEALVPLVSYRFDTEIGDDWRRVIEEQPEWWQVDAV
jgi:hypothetical protein